MPKIFKLSMSEDEVDSDFDEDVDEVIVLDEESEFKDVIFWLIDNDINYHFQTDDSAESAYLVMKDDDSVAFKLRWA